MEVSYDGNLISRGSGETDIVFAFKELAAYTNGSAISFASVGTRYS
jgi:hypothetical protein